MSVASSRMRERARTASAASLRMDAESGIVTARAREFSSSRSADSRSGSFPAIDSISRTIDFARCASESAAASVAWDARAVIERGFLGAGEGAAFVPTWPSLRAFPRRKARNSGM